MSRSLFAHLALLFAISVSAQNSPKSITLTDESNITGEAIRKNLRKGCPDVRITTDVAKSDYTLEAIKRTGRQGLEIFPEDSFDLTLFDPDGNIFSSASDESFGHAMKILCHAIKTSVPVEVVDSKNLTQSVDVRGDTSGGLIEAAVDATGRRTHTDTDSIYVVVNGEHALLDCYERRTGCSTIGPGKYYGERSGDGIWVSYRMPITHKPVRNHYKIAGGW
jgi:hypothetical protein